MTTVVQTGAAVFDDGSNVVLVEEESSGIVAEEPELEILNGRYGPYISYKGSNYRLPKTLKVEPKDMQLAECMEIIREQDEKTASGKGKRTAKKK